MPSKKKSIKCRNMMYEQQLNHLPRGMTIEILYDHIDKKLHPKRWAGIIHDRDLKSDNKTPQEDHVHVMLQFENARSIRQVAKDIGDQPQYLEAWNDKVYNGFAYLIHATTNARYKHQYSADQVTANFDYVSEINRTTKQVSKVEGIVTANKISALLDMVATGEISLKEAKSQLSGSEYAKSDRKLDAAHKLYLERCAEALRERMKQDNQHVEVHWLYGETETGKTILAKQQSEAHDKYYLTTSLKDPFQYYQAEPIIILDELRPDSIPYSEMLAMFDPFSYGEIRMSSRYHNKTLACHTFFVTTPYDPVSFYSLSVAGKPTTIDKPEQLYRRLTSVLWMTEYEIHKMEYDSYSGLYLISDTKPNLYSKKNHPQIITSNLFDEID